MIDLRDKLITSINECGRGNKIAFMSSKTSCDLKKGDLSNWFFDSKRFYQYYLGVKVFIDNKMSNDDFHVILERENLWLMIWDKEPTG